MFTIVIGSKRIAIERQIAFVGRDPACDVVVDDKGVSRRHACFVDLGEKVVLMDFKSANGTFLNARPIEQVDLRPGDEIEVGSTRFTVEVPQPASDRWRISAAGYKPYLATEELDTALRRARHFLLGAEGRRAVELATPLVEALRKDNDPVELSRQALETVSRVSGIDRGMIQLIGQDGSRLGEVARVGFEPEYFMRRNLHYVLIEEAMEERRLVQTRDMFFNSVMRRATMVIPDVHGAVAVPLVHLGTSIGVLYGDRRVFSGAFTEHDVLAMAFCAHQLAAAVGTLKILTPPPRAADIVRVLDQALLDGFAHCEVCGVRIDPASRSLPVVLCARCETPHHKDCWEYNHRCAIYGCMHELFKPVPPRPN